MADPMSGERIAEIRERAQAATKGPWKVEEPFRLKDGTMRHGIASTSQEEDIAALDVCATAWPFQHAEVERDAAFIAHAREDVPALLDEVERLRAERDEERRRNHYERAGNAERENARLRAELAETTHALEVTGEKLTAVRGQRNRAEAERDRIRLAWDSARRGRRSARLLNRELIASMGVLHGRLQQYMDDKNTAAAHFTNQYSRMHLERDQMRTERDEAREQVKRVQDPDLIRRAIADPGAYVKRKRLDNGEPAETVPAWGARAVIAALDGESGR